MIKAALQVLQERKVPMTCPEMIDVMATEGLCFTWWQDASIRYTPLIAFYQRPGQEFAVPQDGEGEV